MYSEHVLNLARLTEQDPTHAHALLEHAVAEGAVRLAGRGGGIQGMSGLPANIPPRIVQYWHAEDPPQDVRQAIDKVQACNPAMACSVFHEADARAFIAAHFGNDMQALFDFCFHHTMKSDLFRLCYLYVHGGIYVDVDIHCHAPLTNMVAGNAFRCFLVYAEGAPWCIENGLIVAEPGNGVILAMIHKLASNLVRYRDAGQFRGIWTETGPGVATEAVMGLFARFILTGEGESLIDGFLAARNDLCWISYWHDELAYKETADGNWRKACAPVQQ